MVSPPRFPDDEQRAVVDAIEGPRLVLAPAGTGKTRVMAERLARALAAGLEPGRALCVTFTNRAAAEMRQRVAERLPDTARRLHVRTFHGLCAWILRQAAPLIGLPRDFVIYDDRDSIDLLDTVLRNCAGRVRSERAPDFFWRLSRRKSNAAGNELVLARIPALFLRPGEESERAATERYQRVLAERHALDFGDLVYTVRALFTHLPEQRETWAARFDWVQVDEVQDTHLSEYEVLRVLSSSHRNLALFGDVDQTIYEWRGSDPKDVLGRFRRDFAPVRQHFLTLNYRATRVLLDAADRMARTFADRKTHVVAHPTLPRGDAVVRHVASTPEREACWVAGEVARIRRDSPDERIGILARTHRRLEGLSATLTEQGVEHVTVEEFEFFRRREIRDVLARLRILLNPCDSGAIRRVLSRPPTGIGQRTLAMLYERGAPAGLRLFDLFDTRTHVAGEPFAELLGALAGDGVVVFDVETTGLSCADDEVVEIAARRVGTASPDGSFHRFLRPGRPVGDSAAVHGWSDEFLREHGEEPAAVFADLLAFVAGRHVVGHNVRFDLAIVSDHARRLGLDVGVIPCDDTLDLARRFVAAERYDLDTLSRTLALADRPSHRAEDDVAATVALLEHLEPRVRQGANRRAELVAEHGGAFEPLARSFESWRRAMELLRPPELLARILVESGLEAYYRADAARARHLADLRRFFHSHDRADLAPRAALEELTQYAALARNVDHLESDDPRIPVVTVHQAKGLEFDTVFVAGLSEGEFPSYLAVRENRIEEERRLFYVALTRARRRLFLSGHEVNEQGRRRGASRFLAEM